MATHTLTTPVGVNDTGLSAIAALIAAHRRAYAAWIRARDNIHRAHEVFDPEHHLEDRAEIEAALRATYGTQGDDAILYYSEMAGAADAAAAAEDGAWQRVASFEPTYAAELRSWLGYVIRHAKVADEAVTLRRALEHVTGQLAERLM